MAKKPKVKIDFYTRDIEEVIKEYLDFGPDNSLCWDDFLGCLSDSICIEFNITFRYETKLADWCGLQMEAMQLLPRALWEEFNVNSDNVRLDYLAQEQDCINGELVLDKSEGIRLLSTHRKYFDKMLAQHKKVQANLELDAKSKLEAEMVRITKELAKYAKAQKGKVNGSKKQG